MVPSVMSRRRRITRLAPMKPAEPVTNIFIVFNYFICVVAGCVDDLSAPSNG